MSKEVENLFTATKQFYSSGGSEIIVPPGSYTVKVYKGFEYRVGTSEFSVSAGEAAHCQVTMERWVNMPDRGWYSADDHLHIARSVPELNPFISQVMQAEDIHVANLLQFGLAHRFHNAVQYALGPGGIYREGDYILAGGQENPRTNFLGHSIILGADTPIHFPDQYLVYRLFWEQAQQQHGLVGHAHLGDWFPGDIGGAYGLPVVVPHGLLNFIEVLQFNRAFYDTWYDMLNLGFRVTPTAGSDYPCVGANIPGRERFFSYIEGDLTYQSWLEAIRRGRTFISNGPVMEFRVNGSGVGEEVTLRNAGAVSLEGSVQFDQTREDVMRIEVVENGTPVHNFPRVGDSGEISFKVDHQIQGSGWLALRAQGEKTDEASHSAFAFSMRDSAAHTAPVYITVEGDGPLSKTRRAKDVAGRWLNRLEDLEARLDEKNITHLADRLARVQLDVVQEEVLQKNRLALIEEIGTAKRYFEGLLG